MPLSERLARLAARLRVLLPAKIAVLLGLSVGICAPYFLLQQADALPGSGMLATPLDLRIAFEPRWIWAYASLALLVPLSPLLATSRDGLVRYARGLAWLCVASFVVFWLVPVVGPRPAATPSDGLYGLIVSVDRPLNSFPSLHAGLTAYSLLYAWRILREALSNRAWRLSVALGVVWAGLILYSTLATKQHWVLDLPAGILLAGAAHALAWRSADRVREAAGFATE